MATLWARACARSKVQPACGAGHHAVPARCGAPGRHSPLAGQEEPQVGRAGRGIVGVRLEGRPPGLGVRAGVGRLQSRGRQASAPPARCWSAGRGSEGGFLLPVAPTTNLQPKV